MIDFRYHIVSLISVFLALAVGIALGAGPLKETIGQSLTGQVSQLRAEKDALRAEADAAHQTTSDEQDFIGEAATQLLADRLTGRQVAVICLGKVSDDIVKAIDARLIQAGATPTGRITLTSEWTDPGQRSYRQALSGMLTQYLNPAPPQGSTAEVTLATALVQGLVQASAADPTRFSDAASSLLGVLTTGDHPAVTVDQTITTPADSVVVVAPPLAAGTKASPPPSTTQTARLAVVAAAQSQSAGAVLVDGPRGRGSLIDALFADDVLRGKVSSVSGIGEVSAQVSVPMALAAQLAGQPGHYGHGDGETVLPPTVTLPAPAGVGG